MGIHEIATVVVMAVMACGATAASAQDLVARRRASVAPLATASSGGEQNPAPENDDAPFPWLLLPVFSSSPKLGTAGGALAAYVRVFDPQSRVSMFGAAFMYTSTDSKVGALFARASFGEDHHRIDAIGGFGYIKNSYDDYLGTGEPLKTNDDAAAFAGRYRYRIRGNWFIGGQMAAVNYQVLGEDALDDELLDTLGVQGFNSVGLGANVSHDSRDNQDMPTTGWFANLNNFAYREWLGGDDAFDVYRLDVRGFVRHGGRHVLAMRQSNKFTADAPVGGQASVVLRGYKQAQYLAKYMSSFEVEERLLLSRRWGATGFAGVASLYGDRSSETNDALYPALGAGLQFVLMPERRLVANFEYAYGNENNSGVYLKLGYAW